MWFTYCSSKFSESTSICVRIETRLMLCVISVIRLEYSRLIFLYAIVIVGGGMTIEKIIIIKSN